MSHRRDVSKTVGRIIEDQRLERYLKRNRTYYCISCSGATISEAVVNADALRLLEPEKTPHIVVYKIKCKDRKKPTIYDRIGACYSGDNDLKCSAETCATCKHGQMVEVPVDPPQINQYHKDYRCYRHLYRCTNPIRMEHFSNDTLMAAYIVCDQFEKR